MKTSLHEKNDKKTTQPTVYTQTVDAIFLDKITDPRAVTRYNSRILSIEVWERNNCVTEPTILNAGKVIPVDGAVGVILGLDRAYRQIPQTRERIELPVL
jgi:hypothetical protein